jgi:hypothetical protein
MRGALLAVVMFPAVIVVCPNATVTTYKPMQPASGAGVTCVPVVAEAPAFTDTTAMPFLTVF